MHNRQFQAAVSRRAWLWARNLGLVAAGGLAVAAVGCSRRPAGLTHEEQRLVSQLLVQARARLTAAAADSAAAHAELSGTGPAWLDSAEVAQRLEGPWAELWRDPERGRRVLQAVHDSLEALRPVLFPPSQRPAPPPSSASPARPRIP